jgi:uridylate kinase
MAGSSSKDRTIIVIKLSGRVFSGDDKGADIKKYAGLLAELSAKVQPVVVAGGGKMARHYIDIARGFGLDEASLDIMGIEVSRLNAKLLIAALGRKAYPSVPEDLEQVTDAAVASSSSSSGKVIVTGGLHPGQSTNATAALIAEKVGAKKIINATDVDGIYDSDPRTNKNAKMFNEITTRQCRELDGRRLRPYGHCRPQGNREIQDTDCRDQIRPCDNQKCGDRQGDDRDAHNVLRNSLDLAVIFRHSV